MSHYIWFAGKKVLIQLSKLLLQIKKLFFLHIKHFFLKIFFASGLTLSFSTLLHIDPAAHQNHCGRCRIRNKDLCPGSLESALPTSYHISKTFPINNFSHFTFRTHSSRGGDYILQYKQFGKQKTSRVWQKYLFGMLSFVQVFVLGNLAVKVSRYVILSSIEHYMDK